MSDSNPVRVMHFIHSLKGGGAERQLTYLINHTDPGKITHAVCCFNDEGKEELDSRCDIFNLDRKGKYDFKFREIFKLLSAWNPDIVHNWLPNVQVNSFIPSRFYGKSLYIDSNHSMYRFNRPYRVFQALVYLFSDGLITVTAPEKLFFPFRQIFNIKDSCFVPNGIPVKDIESTKPALPDGLQHGSDESLLLFVGRLSPEKNIPHMLQSISQLSSEGLDLKLLICGEGRSRALLEQQVHELGIEERVYFLGYREDVYSFMKSCDLLVLPSFREGMGNVVFEALAAGLPVIGSRIPSLEYWFENNGIVSLFDPYSVDEISECIRRELGRSKDEKERRKAEAGQFIKELDVEVMIRKYTNLYLGLYQREGEASCV